VRAAFAQFAPQIQLGGNSWTHREGSSEDVDWELGISGEIPLFDGGVRLAELRVARSQRRQARERLASIQKQIRCEVEDLHGKLVSQDQAIAAAEAQLNSASEAYAQVWAEYQEGDATNLEVITAENLRLSAEIRHYQELLRKKVLWLQLQVAAGSAPVARQKD
jgi:outer membrane protein TolC